MTLSLAELARSARDADMNREIPPEDYDAVFGGCMSQTCDTSKGCVDDPDDDAC